MFSHIHFGYQHHHYTSLHANNGEHCTLPLFLTINNTRPGVDKVKPKGWLDHSGPSLLSEFFPSCLKVIGGWGGSVGGPQDYCVSPSPLWALWGWNWVGLGLGGLGTQGLGTRA